LNDLAASPHREGSLQVTAALMLDIVYRITACVVGSGRAAHGFARSHLRLELRASGARSGCLRQRLSLVWDRSAKITSAEIAIFAELPWSISGFDVREMRENSGSVARGMP